jgi:hypothetical protein
MKVYEASTDTFEMSKQKTEIFTAKLIKCPSRNYS